jgi:uncharacterized protein (DUF433 family)
LSEESAATSYEHVVLDENGVPVIAGANTKVIEIVLDTLAHGSSPAELHFQFPHLTLGQIHSALGDYWDHREELDADIERRLESVEKVRQELDRLPLVDRLKRRGLL